MIDRRTFGALLPVAAIWRTARAQAAESDLAATVKRRFAEIEAMVQGRLGVHILDSATGAGYGHRSDERFMLLSSFKLLACGHLLHRVDRGEASLDHRVRYTRDDLVTYSPVTEKHVGADGMTLGALCEATITTSDNTAGNLVLDSCGGPAALTAYLRGLGDRVTRLDRRETALNEADSSTSEPLDTTTPRAMVQTIRALLLGSALSATSRTQLQRWLLANQTGGKRLKAGLPPDWQIGDKTGSSGMAANDVAIVWPPAGRAPLLVAAYIDASRAGRLVSEQGLAEVGEMLRPIVNG